MELFAKGLFVLQVLRMLLRGVVVWKLVACGLWHGGNGDARVAIPPNVWLD